MQCYDRIDISEGIDVNKISFSKECIICHDWYFLDKGFQLSVSNGCHNVLMMSTDLKSIAPLNTHVVNYCCIISEISKSEAMNLLKKTDLIEKMDH